MTATLSDLREVHAGSYSVPIIDAPRDDLPTDQLGEYGRLRAGRPVILIHEDLRGDFREFVLGHEIVHAWLRAYGLEAVLPDGAEERICDALGHELALLVRGLT